MGVMLDEVKKVQDEGLAALARIRATPDMPYPERLQIAATVCLQTVFMIAVSLASIADDQAEQAEIARKRYEANYEK